MGFATCALAAKDGATWAAITALACGGVGFLATSLALRGQDD